MTQTIATCGDCGQLNRLPLTLATGKAVVCGRCKAPLDDSLDDDEDGDEDGDDGFDDDEDDEDGDGAA